MEIKKASELKQILADRCAQEPVGEVAKELKIQPVYLLQLIAGQRYVSKKVAARMGYKLVTVPKPEPIFERIM